MSKAPATSSQSPSIVELLDKASAADTEAIDAKIVDLQTQVAALENQIASLKLVRKVIDVKLNGKPERKPKQARKAKPASSDGDTDNFSKIKNYLEHAGETKAATIAADTGLSSATVFKYLNEGVERNVFVRGLSGYGLRRNGQHA